MYRNERLTGHYSRIIIVILAVLICFVLFPFNTSSAQEVNQAMSAQASQALQQAEAHWKAKDWSNAVQGFQHIIEQYPSLPEAAQAHIRIGQFYEEDDLAKAVSNFTNAKDTAPGTKIAAQARMELARFSFLTGDYFEARNQLAKAIQENTDWDTVKEATYLYKYIARVVSQIDEGSQLVSSCGTESLKEVAHIKGIEIKKVFPGNDLFLTLKDIKDAAQSIGLKAEGVHLSYEQALHEIPRPWIAHFKKNHFVVVTEMDNDQVSIIDSERGVMHFSADGFNRRWSGKGLVFPDDSKRLNKQFLLSEAELNSVRGGHHLHAHNFGGCNPSSSYSGGTHSLSGGQSPGMPDMLINLSNLNFIVTDKDISVSGRGPDLSVTRTYNSDDSFEGIFGRSWVSSYESYLTENPGGDVDIKQPSGKLNNFTPGPNGTYNAPRWSYDTLVKNPDGSFDLTLKSSKTVKHFDTSGRMTSIADRHGNSVTLQYDAQNRLETVMSATGKSIIFRYGSNNKVSEIEGPLQKKAYFQYDANNNLTQTEDMAGNIVSYTYNSSSYMTSLTTENGTTTINNVFFDDGIYTGYIVTAIIDPLGNRMDFWSDTYVNVRDPNGVIWKIFNISPDGEATEIYLPGGGSIIRTLNSKGFFNSETDPNGNTTSWIYDSNGNITSISSPLVNSTSMTYTPADFINSITDSTGSVYDFDYDANDNLVSATDPENGVTRLTYSQYGEVKSIIDANGNAMSVTYDPNGSVSLINSPLGYHASFTYDDRGRVVTATDEQDRTTTLIYDNIDRITHIQYDDQTEEVINYDCCGITNITSPSGTLYFNSDKDNRLTSSTDVYGNTLGYKYDKAGRLVTLTYPDNKQVNYAYDVKGRLISLNDWLGNTTNYKYDLGGRLTKISRPDGSIEILSYDAADRLLTSIDYNANGAVISSYDYSYDQLGNRTDISAYQPLQQNPHPGTEAYAYNAENRLTSTSSSTFSYDNGGYLINSTTGGSIKDYTWTITGMLNSIAVDGNIYEYSYDGLENRISKTVGGSTTRYVVTPEGVTLAETDAQGTITAYYVYGLGMVSKVTPAGATYYYHYDGIGSTVAITNATGTVVNTYAYGIFGQLLDSNETITNPFRFVGALGVIDDGSGLYYMTARYYDSENGRFISKDPIGLEGGINMYAYAGNNPVNHIDPSGLCASGYYYVSGIEYGGFLFFVGVKSSHLKFSCIGNSKDTFTGTFTSIIVGGGLGGGVGTPAGVVKGCNEEEALGNFTGFGVSVAAFPAPLALPESPGLGASAFGSSNFKAGGITPGYGFEVSGGGSYTFKW